MFPADLEVGFSPRVKMIEGPAPHNQIDAVGDGNVKLANLLLK